MILLAMEISSLLRCKLLSAAAIRDKSLAATISQLSGSRARALLSDAVTASSMLAGMGAEFLNLSLAA